MTWNENPYNNSVLSHLSLPETRSSPLIGEIFDLGYLTQQTILEENKLRIPRKVSFSDSLSFTQALSIGIHGVVDPINIKIALVQTIERLSGYKGTNNKFNRLKKRVKQHISNNLEEKLQNPSTLQVYHTLILDFMPGRFHLSASKISFMPDR